MFVRTAVQFKPPTIPTNRAAVAFPQEQPKRKKLVKHLLTFCPSSGVPQYH